MQLANGAHIQQQLAGAASALQQAAAAPPRPPKSKAVRLAIGARELEGANIAYAAALKQKRFADKAAIKAKYTLAQKAEA
eukprot:574939-Pyramimonas_sp.AAC.1